MASSVQGKVSSRLYNHIHKFFQTKRTSFFILLLSTAVVTITALGIYSVRRSMSGIAPSTIPTKIAKTNAAISNAPLTKLKEYVYVGGRLLSSEEKGCVPSLDSTSVNIPQGGGTGSISFSILSICSWTTVSNASWITITSGATGTGNGVVRYSVTANSGAQRSSTITINGQAFTINQAPVITSCSYAMNRNSESVSEQGGSGSLVLTTGAGCTWMASSNVTWLSVTSAASGTGSATINYSVAANSGQQRSGTITVGGQSFTVTQAPNQASCTFSLSPGSQSFGSGPESGSFNVSTGAGCIWDAANGDGWITITGGATGIGNGSTSFSVQANSGGARTSTIVVRGQTFTITQDGCSYSISPTNDDVGAGGGTGSISVSTGPSCPWSASSNYWWITITSGSSGTGDGTVNYSVSANSTQGGDDRYGAIAVGGHTFTISQLPAPCQCRPGHLECCEESSMSFSSESKLGPGGLRLLPVSDNHRLILLLIREELTLLITVCLLLILNRRLIHKWFLLFKTKVCLILRKIIILIVKITEMITENLLSLLCSRRFIRFKFQTHRALVITLIASLMLQQTPAQAQELSYGVESIWKSINEIVKHSVKRPSRHRFTLSSAMVQAEQVINIQICPKQLVMYVGERYTLTPVPLSSDNKVVQGISLQWNSLVTGIAKVTSFGQVEAVSIGTTTIEVHTNNVSKQVPVEVRSGTRPVGSNQEADIDTTDCAGDQAAMYSSQSIAANENISSLIDETVQLDWDPEPVSNSLATYYYNAVGSPRFFAKSGNIQLGSSSYQYNLPVTSFGGRGASANIGMTLNSRVWNYDDGKMTFNYVGAYPAPGWSMGYGKIIRNYNNTATGNKSGIGNSNNPGDYLMVSGDGTRTRLVAKYVSSSDRWIQESDNGSFLQFNPVSGEMRYPDGSKMIYSSVNGALLPTAIVGTNGGAITMSYRDYCEGNNCVREFRHRTALNAVRDTLGRYVTFHYYGDDDYPADSANGKPGGELAAIKAPNMSGVQMEVIRVEYQAITLKYDFGSMAVVAPANNSQIQVVRRVYYPQTGGGILFLDYSSYGMPRKISSRMAMTGTGGAITDGTEVRYTKYNYLTIDPSDPYGRNQSGSLNDFPIFTQREEWWQGKTDGNGTPTTEPTVYEYSSTAESTTETRRIKHIGRNYEEVTTTGNNDALTYGKVISVESRNSSTGTVLNKQNYTYTTGPDGEAQIEKVESIDETGQRKLVSFAYGHYGRMTDQYEYGYKQGDSYQVQRRTHYDFVDDQSYLNERFLLLINRVTVYDANNTLKAKTETLYDDYASMGGMQSYSIYPPNHDTEYNQNKMLRGNITGVRTFSKLNPEESTLRRMKYDIFGNVVKAEVSCCMTRSFSFTEATWYSQPYSIQSGNTGELNLTTYREYNFVTGLVVNETNADGWITYYEYDNALRLRKITSPTGAEQVTQLERDGNGNDLLSSINQVFYDDEGTQKVITSKQWFNGAGQVLRAGTGTGVATTSFDMTRAIYDDWGRVSRQSNPYTGDASGEGSAQYWTTNTYDDLSRVVQVKLPDNQSVQTSYSRAAVIATDTVGRKRKSEVDGLGRLVKVTEQNPANGNLEWETNYSYDTLNNLTQTNQGGQIRSFVYDANGRLLSETLPESGTTTYTYTNFDAVSTRTDARGVVATYSYGQMNLLTGITYNTTNAPGVAATTAVNITYKTDSPAKTQVSTVTDGAGIESFSYDSLGRVIAGVQVIDGTSYKKEYQYNLIGQMTRMIYPSGKRMKVTHDGRGRVSVLQGLDAGDNVQANYLSSINYRVDGLVSSQVLGDGTTESLGYSNDRLQLTSQKVTKGSSTLLEQNYSYHATAGQMGSGTTSGNSGQLVGISGTIKGQNRNQSFTYDNVGRLTTAIGWNSWQRRYEYDRYGNRTAVFDSTTNGNNLQNTIIQEASSVKTNRIASVNGINYSYDAQGNVTSDGSKTLTYDAMNRLVGVGGSVSESYSHDASNHRVKKVSGGVTTHYIWEGSQVIAEYEYGGSNTSAQGTRYYHQDKLSSRLITDSSGTVVGTMDHLPFGETAAGGGESDKRRFTSYERDATGLDYAVNRHFASDQGGFMQVDPIGMASVSLGSPQTLNLYTYVANDPINLTDPLGLLLGPGGLGWWGIDGGGGGGLNACADDPWGENPNCSINDGKSKEADEALEKYEQRLKNTHDAAAARKAFNSGDYSRAQAILNNNSDVGVQVNGGDPLWGKLGAEFVGGFVLGTLFASHGGGSWSDAIKNGIRSGWERVGRYVSKLRGPDFLVVSLIAPVLGPAALGGGFSIAGGDWQNPIYNVSAGTGVEGSLYMGWIIQSNAPELAQTRSWLSGTSFTLSGAYYGGGGVVYAPTSSPHFAFLLGVGYGGKGAGSTSSMSVSDIQEFVRRTLKGR